jgi:alkylation response protein AidB-like acyl-CoA dehydrogenase
MDLSLTETQTLLKDTATQFMETELPKQRVREVDESPTGFNQDLWQKMSDLGLVGMAIPEQYDGGGNTLTDVAVVQEVLGYYACSSPFLDSGILSAQAILAAGSDAQKSALLPAIAKGQQICSFAFTEPEYGWGSGAVHMSATQSGGNFALNGTKVFVPWAHVADQILVVARTSDDGPDHDQGLTMFLVDKNASGLSVRLHSGWLGDKVCEVTFNNVEVQSANVIGPVGGAWAAINTAIDRATALLSIYMAGGAQKAYEMCRDYSTERIAFGVPIGTFQRVQDHIIVALTEAEAAKWTSYEALWRLDTDRDDAAVGVSMAKAVSSDGFSKACDASHNVHAGVGVDLDFGLTHYTVRARTFQHYLGDATFHKNRMAQLMDLG